MRSPIFATLLWLVTSFAAAGDDTAHFKRLDIPKNEARLSELAGVREFRCSFELGHFCIETLLIAEVFHDGKCTKRYRLSRIPYDPDTKIVTGTISIGWQSIAHRIVSVQDRTGSEWVESASAPAPNFEPWPRDQFYFVDSRGEKRREGDRDFELFPVLGFCGPHERMQIRLVDVRDKESFLAACKAAHEMDAVVIYIYMNQFGLTYEDPPLEFNE
jgi:hypothetical protein